MEYLDIRTLSGQPTGQIKERKAVHRDGDLHGTSHVFIIRRNSFGECEILLQKRADDKDAFPGCYDISSAGHIPAGQDYLESALRELEEELGIKAEAEDLIEIGFHEGYSKEVFYNEPFINHEISKVYIYRRNTDEKTLKLQKEEISSVKWFTLAECMKAVESGDPTFCLFIKELELIDKYYIENKNNL